MQRCIGFVGSKNGLSPAQEQTLGDLLRRAADRIRTQQDEGWLEHPDLQGATVPANALAKHYGLRISVHPCDNVKLRSHFMSDRRNPERPYLECGKSVVDASYWLIAAPDSDHEDRYSGTWSAVRYARQQAKPITLILPDGRVRSERD